MNIIKGNNQELQVQMGRLIEIIQGKSKELMELGVKVGEYQGKYQKVKLDCTKMEKIINQLIKDSKNDIKNM